MSSDLKIGKVAFTAPTLTQNPPTKPADKPDDKSATAAAPEVKPSGDVTGEKDKPVTK